MIYFVLAAATSPSPLSRAFLQRVVLLAVLLGVEAVTASIFLDGDTLAGKPGVLTALLRGWGSWTLSAAIGFAALFATFAWLQHRWELTGLSARAEGAPIAWKFVPVHGISVLSFAVLSAAVYGASSRIAPDLLVAVWGAAGIAAVISAALVIVPWAIWSDLLRITGRLALYAGAASVVACILGRYSRLLWTPTARLTFQLVRTILQPFFHHVVVQPGVLRVGTQKFTAIVSPECSGLEGIGLLLIFSAVWLFVFREETRFPQALILLPAAVATLYLLNVGRIAVLIVIGHFGAREIATRGFHSQAGWIAFNGVAFGFSLAARRLHWFSKSPGEPGAAADSTYNPAAAYLVPFLAILGARMISRAGSGGFEWLYPIGFFASGIALVAMRRRYADLSRRIGWMAAVTGAAVFVLWLALDWTRGAAGAGLPAVLAAAPPPMRYSWIAIRIFSAVITVPIAEELAFRGYLLRRLVQPEFETVAFSRWTWTAIVVSSLAFGTMHGGRWIAGTVAGGLYAFTAIRSGHLADAIAAHAVTNFLLAAYVLCFSQWQLW